MGKLKKDPISRVKREAHADKKVSGGGSACIVWDPEDGVTIEATWAVTIDQVEIVQCDIAPHLNGGYRFTVKDEALRAKYDIYVPTNTVKQPWAPQRHGIGGGGFIDPVEP